MLPHFRLSEIHPVMTRLCQLHGTQAAAAEAAGLGYRRFNYLYAVVAPEKRAQTRVRFEEGDAILTAAGLHYRQLGDPFLVPGRRR